MEEKERGKGWRKGARGEGAGGRQTRGRRGVSRGGKRKDTVEGGAERGEMGRGRGQPKRRDRRAAVGRNSGLELKGRKKETVLLQTSRIVE